jgi:hypothetical protein
MSDIGGQATGKGGDAQQTQYPFFQSAGGVTPEQTALADYSYGQNLTEGQGQFGNSPEAGEGGGNALSTMATQVAGGANTGKALNLAGSSDADQDAQLKAYDNSINIDQQNNAAGLAEQEQQQSQITSLASLAGAAAGGKAATGAST